MHTIGPWYVQTTKEQGIETIVVVSPNESRLVSVCRVGRSGGWRVVQDANLIAAAPDLLAACKDALGAFENGNAIDWGDLERAIAKAEGEANNGTL